MDISKIDLSTNHAKWCDSFVKEQGRTSRLVRRVLKSSRRMNPFDTSRNIDKILKRYEKSFWG